jgi:molybdopterin-guanine dinucleotide biosynthesis protein A
VSPGPSPGPEAPALGAVVLTGGGAVRLQGADKASIEVGGTTLLEHVLSALAAVPEVVVVGEEVPTSRPVTFRREDPPGGGPAAGLLAGLAGFARPPHLVLVLAVDMPRVTGQTVRRLVGAAEQDGALLVDHDGRRQYLCAAYRTTALLTAAPPSGEEHGLAVRRLVRGLDLAEVPALGGETQDVDTWEDLLALRSGWAVEGDARRNPQKAAETDRNGDQ